MKKIAIAEDDAAIMDVLEITLTGAGYGLMLYPKGEALLVPHALPDLYLLDKQLAGIDGLDICRSLKSGGPTSHIPVIMLSANPHIGKLAVAAGANGFLEKPFEIQDLLQVVQTHISS